MPNLPIELKPSLTPMVPRCLSFCDPGGYRCGLNIKLRKHKQKHHIQQPDSKEPSPKLKYQCDGCDFSSDYRVQTVKHRLSEHPELATKFLPTKSEDLIPSLIVEQNIENGKCQGLIS